MFGFQVFGFQMVTVRVQLTFISYFCYNVYFIDTSSLNPNDSRPSNSNKSAKEDRTDTNAPDQISFSMLDQNVLDELPDDVKKEILDFYKNQEHNLKETPKNLDRSSKKSQIESTMQQKVTHLCSHMLVLDKTCK